MREPAPAPVLAASGRGGLPQTEPERPGFPQPGSSRSGVSRSGASPAGAVPLAPGSTQPEEGDDAPTLATELRVCLLRCARRLRAEKADTDLSDSQFSVLAVLDRHGPMTPRELADHERVQPPSMTRTLAHVLDRGLVARTAHPADGRQVVITLTGGGREIVLETRRRRTAWLAREIEALSPADRSVLLAATEILRRITDS